MGKVWHTSPNVFFLKRYRILAWVRFENVRIKDQFLGENKLLKVYHFIKIKVPAVFELGTCRSADWNYTH